MSNDYHIPGKKMTAKERKEAFAMLGRKDKPKRYKLTYNGENVEECTGKQPYAICQAVVNKLMAAGLGYFRKGFKITKA